MHQMPVIDASILCFVLRHGRHDDAIFKCEIPKFQRRKHGRTQGGVGLHAGLPHEPTFRTFEPVFISEAQVFVTDPLAARQHRIIQLNGIKSQIEFHPFKPFH